MSIPLFLLLRKAPARNNLPEIKVPLFCRENGVHCDCCTDKAPLECRKLVKLYYQSLKLEDALSTRLVKELKNTVHDAECRKETVAVLESLVLLSKALRVQQFSLAESIKAADEGLKMVRELGAPVSENEEWAIFKREITWSLLNEKIWTLLYFRRFEEAVENAKKLPDLKRDGIERFLTELYLPFAEFIKVYDSGSGEFGKAGRLFSEAGRKAQEAGFKSLAEQARLYEGFCVFFDRVNERTTYAEKVFNTLSTSDYRHAKVNAFLGLALCKSRRGENPEFYLEKYSRLQKDEHGKEVKYRTSQYPWFTFSEINLRAELPGADIDNYIETTRKLAFPVLVALETMTDLKSRISFARHLYHIYSLRTGLFIKKARIKPLPEEEIKWMVISMERSRRCGVVPWFAKEASEIVGGIFSSDVSEFNSGSLKPAQRVLLATGKDSRLLVLFICKEPQPVLAWFIGGKAYYSIYEEGCTEKRILGDAVKKVSADTRHIIIFGDESIYKYRIDYCSFFGGGSRRMKVFMGEDLFRVARSIDKKYLPPKRILFLYGEYGKSCDRIDPGEVRKYVKDMSLSCKYEINERPMVSFEDADKLFEFMDGFDTAFIYAHGEKGTTVYSQKIRTGKFDITAKDIFRNAAHIKGKRILLCCCSTGFDPSGCQKEVLALGSMMVSAGAGLVYCPIDDFRQDEFTARTDDFLKVLIGENLQNRNNCDRCYSPAWRFIV